MDGIIADGAIRSGKSVSMSLSFVLWGMESFENQNFGMCGKTIGSFRRNVLFWLKLMLRSRGYKVHEYRSENYITVERKGVLNYFYIFGGKDERSQDLIQGITLAGIFFDEVVLMPESFVNQATGRCSVEGSKYWFNCNPGNPSHWFYKQWIEKKKEKRIIYLHFLMTDNLSLSKKTIEKYERIWGGMKSFYDRYIRGLWTVAEGLIYSSFNDQINIAKTEPRLYEKFYISMDYGTLNPTAMILWGLSNKAWYAVEEYYHSGRDTNQQKTDEEYYVELNKLAGNRKIQQVIIDPSAASFITLVQRKGKFAVRKANNTVIDGIREVSTALQVGLIKINDCCKNTIQEFKLYSWDEKSVEDRPIKENDHAMDAVRYFVKTLGIAKYHINKSA